MLNIIKNYWYCKLYNIRNWINISDTCLFFVHLSWIICFLKGEMILIHLFLLLKHYAETDYQNTIWLLKTVFILMHTFLI